MKGFVGVSDDDGYAFLSQLPNIDEVNFWQPGGSSYFKALQAGDPENRYGEPTLVLPRLGQGSFRIMVADAYERRCAITHEKTLPALEAAHIKPFSASGPHHMGNGILLRSDIHKLFDSG